MSNMFFRLLDRLVGYEFSARRKSIADLSARLATASEQLESVRKDMQRVSDGSPDSADGNGRLSLASERTVADAVSAQTRALEARLTFLERCIGVNDLAQAPNDPKALDTILDQRLAMLESRILAVLEGSYLDRIAALARADHA